jgi:hypothetical protein
MRYKIEYKSGKEYEIESDLDSAAFVKQETRSGTPDKIWVERSVVLGLSKEWKQIYPAPAASLYDLFGGWGYP